MIVVRSVHRRAVVTLLMVLVTATTVHARPGMRTVRLRMEGYFGPPVAEQPTETNLVLRIGADDRVFQVTKGRVPSGRLMAADVFAQVRVHKPNFTLRGPKALVDKASDVTDGALVVIDGQWIVNSPDFLLAALAPPRARP